MNGADQACDYNDVEDIASEHGLSIGFAAHYQGPEGTYFELVDEQGGVTFQLPVGTLNVRLGEEYSDKTGERRPVAVGWGRLPE